MDHIVDTSAHGVGINDLRDYLVTLHTAEAAQTSIRCGERFNAHPTFEPNTTVV
jgi:hypothetical protein